MSTKTPGPKRTFYLLPEQGFLNVSHTILFMPLLLCFYYKSLSHSWSGHTHTHTHKHALTACILHYIIPLLVGLVPWVGRESEWSHYTTVTSLLQSPQQPGVLQQQKQHNRVISSLQLQHNVQGVLCISIYIFIKKSFLVITFLLYCCAMSWWYLVQSVGFLLNNGETVVAGQWEVWGFFFFSEQQRRVWKKWGLKEYGKVTQPKPKLWLKGEPRCRWAAPGFYRSSSKERISGHFLSPQILHHSYIKTFWKRSLDREQSEFIHCIFLFQENWLTQIQSRLTCAEMQGFLVTLTSPICYGWFDSFNRITGHVKKCK